jgi:hypothetical protein
MKKVKEAVVDLGGHSQLIMNGYHYLNSKLNVEDK